MSVKQVFNTSAELDYPTVLPTLDLDFANSKTLDPRITFTRASGGSYVGADGLIKLAGVNEARFDHNPVTGESLGLLVEESRSNLVTYSTYNPSWWGNTFPANATLSTGIDAPDGSNTAVRFSCTPTGSSLLRLSFPSFTPNGTTAFTCSFYARLISGTTSFANILSFDLADRIPGGNYLPFLVKDKWVRVVFTGTPSSAFVISFMDLLSDNTNNYTIDYWGAQVEEGAFATSYIPTEGSTRTRAADNASITGKNFSEWYRQDEGTIYADTKINGVQTTRYDRLWAITNANLNYEGISIFISGPGGNYYVFAISVTNSPIEQVGETVPETAFTTPRLKSVFALKQNNCAGAVNGQQRFVDSTVDLSLFTTPVDRLLIGQPQRFQGTSCMTISSFTYYPKRLPDAQLQALTS